MSINPNCTACRLKKSICDHCRLNKIRCDNCKQEFFCGITLPLPQDGNTFDICMDCCRLVRNSSEHPSNRGTPQVLGKALYDMQQVLKEKQKLLEEKEKEILMLKAELAMIKQFVKPDLKESKTEPFPCFSTTFVPETSFPFSMSPKPKPDTPFVMKPLQTPPSFSHVPTFGDQSTFGHGIATHNPPTNPFGGKSVFDSQHNMGQGTMQNAGQDARQNAGQNQQTMFGLNTFQF